MFRQIFVLLSILIIAGCSSESIPEPEPENNNPVTEEEPIPEEENTSEDNEPEAPVFDISIFFTSEQGEMQVDINSDLGITRRINLTEELGIENLQNSTRIAQDNSISFTSWWFENSRVFQKDLTTSIPWSADNFCGFPSEPDVANSIQLVSGNTDYIFYVYYSDKWNEGIWEYYITIFDKDGNQCHNITLLPINKYAGIVSYAIQGNLLALHYFHEDTEQPVVTLIDLSTSQLIKNFEFDDQFYSSILHEHEYFIFNADRSYQVYNTKSAEYVRQGMASNLPIPQDGLFEADILGNKVVSKIKYIGPYSQIFTPVIYDFNTDSVIAGDGIFIEKLEDLVSETVGDPPFFDNFQVDLERNWLVITYKDNTGDGSGGVVFTNFDLTAYKIIQLDFVPEDIVLQAVN